VDFCTVTTADNNVWMRAGINGVSTRFADRFRWRSSRKKKIDNESEDVKKKPTMISKSGTVRGFVTGGGTAGAVDANGVTTTTTQHTITGGLELERCKST
jgi:hypothetical protein